MCARHRALVKLQKKMVAIKANHRLSHVGKKALPIEMLCNHISVKGFP